MVVHFIKLVTKSSYDIWDDLFLIQRCLGFLFYQSMTVGIFQFSHSDTITNVEKTPRSLADGIKSLFKESKVPLQRL